jgi:hypothetical protein
MIRLLATLVLGVLLLPSVTSAQSAANLLDQGVRAYGSREYDGGAWLLRRALAAQGADGLSRAETARALLYLAATEVARNQRDSALVAARRLLLIDAKYRPDDQAFPPQVIALFQEARRSAPTVTMRAVGDTAIRPGMDTYVIRLASASGPDVSAAITAADGRVVRTLYQGPVRDSIDVRWNGLDVSGAPPPAGRYALTVVPTARDRRGTWVLRLPLEITRPAVDTAAPPPAPPDSLFRPEKGNYQGAWRALAPGVAAGLAIIVLPKIVASGEHASNARLIVGGTVTAAGIAAFLSHRPGRTLPSNTQYNRNLRENWRRNSADITRRNAERMRQARIYIRAGAPVLTTSEAAP